MGELSKTQRPASVINGVSLHVPPSFAGILPLSSKRNFQFEPYSFLGLRHSLREGDAALDIGCSYGVMSTLMGKLVGDSGRCCSLEANSEVIGMARRLIADNGLSSNVSVHNTAVSDRPGEVEFYAVPGLQSTASSVSPKIRGACPGAVLQKVKAVTIDEFCLENKISPKCIKIDVEGSECVAVRGARRIVKDARPDLVIETHGTEIMGVGGSLEELVTQLEADGYGLLDLCTGERVAAARYARDYADVIGTCLASARMSDAGIESIRRDLKGITVQGGTGPNPAVSGEMAYTGERIVPGKVPPMLEKEHLARYALAAGMVPGKRVLDMGCGAGYGSDLLLNAGARSVLGVDSSEEAIEYAREHYGREGLEFARTDAARLEARAKFDVAVAFEVIEHTKDHAGFMDAAKRALAGRGVMIISTPNRQENPPGYSNPFHEKEMDEQEFRTLLEARFKHVHLLYQSHVFGVAITGGRADAGGVSYALDPAAMKKQYLVAVCGDALKKPPEGRLFPVAFDHGDYFSQISTDADIGALRSFVDSGRFDEAYAFAQRTSGSGAEWTYLAAVAAHMTGRHDECLPLYDEAEELGFDAFWVHYNRGQALISMNRIDRGRADLEAALAIDPTHKDAREVLNGLDPPARG